MKDIPKELQQRKQWILWKFLPDKSGRVTKVPFQVTGKMAASTRPEEWSDFKEAKKALEASKETSDPYSGLAYVFNKDIIGIDLDYAFYTEGEKKGEMKPWARATVATLDGYTEYSPTRINGIPKGVHILLNGTADIEKHKKGLWTDQPGHADAIEVYTIGRFFTVTGDVFEDKKEFKDVNPKIFESWYKTTFPEKEERPAPSPVSSSVLPPDEQIVEKMRASRNGPKFRALYERGEWEVMGFASQSEADLSLAGNLMFFSCNDMGVADRLFRTSKLFRKKWDDKRGTSTYGKDTLQKARRSQTMNWLDPFSDDPQDIGVPIRLFGDIVVEKTELGYVTRQPVHNGEVVFTFTELSQSRQKLEAYVEAKILPNDDKESTPYANRYDVKSPSQQADLVTALNKAFGDNKRGGYNWTLLTNAAFQGLAKRMLTDTGIVSVIEDKYEEPKFLLYPFLQQDSTNMIFASSETGKSWTALFAAIAIASGKSILGYDAPTEFKTLYIDYEDSKSVFASRLHRLCEGAELDFREVARYVEYMQPMGSVRDNVEVLRRIITENRYSLIIIDAGGDAAGGSPNDEQKVIDLFNALQTLPGTKLIIHHEPKDTSGRDDTSAFYGSMYWRGRSRVAWRLVKQSEDKSGTLIKMTLAKKSNLGHIDAIYYRIAHETRDAAFLNGGRETPRTTITLEEEPKGTDEREMVLTAIGADGASMSEINNKVFLAPRKVRTVLEGLSKDGLIELQGGSKNAKWTLKNDE